MTTLQSHGLLFKTRVTKEEFKEICALHSNSRYLLKNREVVQQTVVKAIYFGPRTITHAFCGIPIFGAVDSLYFKSVFPHKDHMWEFSGLCPYFVHQVIKGSFDLVTKEKTVTYKKGDVFYMNPMAKHAVKTKTTCITKTFVTGRKYLRNWIKIDQTAHIEPTTN